jgi:hypothetical protein
MDLEIVSFGRLAHTHEKRLQFTKNPGDAISTNRVRMGARRPRRKVEEGWPNS